MTESQFVQFLDASAASAVKVCVACFSLCLMCFTDMGVVSSCVCCFVGSKNVWSFVFSLFVACGACCAHQDLLGFYVIYRQPQPQLTAGTNAEATAAATLNAKLPAQARQDHSYLPML